MEKISPETMQLITEINAMNARRRKNGDAHENGLSDRYGFEFEQSDCFSDVPLDFTERTIRLQAEVREMFGLTMELNRHSPLFMRASGRLEKMLTHLGSYCITKAVMEQQGETFRLLKNLNILWLRQMTAANFRKCYASFMESRELGRYNPAAFEIKHPDLIQTHSIKLLPLAA